MEQSRKLCQRCNRKPTCAAQRPRTSSPTPRAPRRGTHRAPPGRVPPGRGDSERDGPTVAFSPRHKLQRRVEGCGQDPNRGGGEAKASPTTSAASSTKSLHSSACFYTCNTLFISIFPVLKCLTWEYEVFLRKQSSKM